MANDRSGRGIRSLNGKRDANVYLLVKMSLMLSWGYDGVRSLSKSLRVWKLRGPRKGRET